MSKGPGKLQNAILSHMRASNSAIISLEQLRWQLWTDRTSNPSDFSNECKFKAFDTSFRRSLKSLVKTKRDEIVIEKRKLQSLEEVYEHYPHKSTDSTVRRLREVTLPSLFAWAPTVEDWKMYSVRDNEEYHTEHLTYEKVMLLRERWETLKGILIQCFAKCDGQDQDHLFNVIAKGESLFRDPLLISKRTLSDCVENCRSICSLPAGAFKELGDISEMFLPKEEERFLRVKSIAHRISDFPRHGGSNLKNGALAFLEDQQFDELKVLPEYRTNKIRKRRQGRIVYAVDVDFQIQSYYVDSKIHRIVDKSIFLDFTFVKSLA